jgi:hypothetical protein
LSPYAATAVEVDGRAVLAEAAKDETADATVRLGRRLLQRIFRTRGLAEPIPQAIIDLAAEPKDPDLQAALRVEIRKALLADSELAEDVHQMVADRAVVSDLVTIGDHNASSPMARVFISYAHEDDDFAGQLAVALAREGVKPWMDTQELRAGDELLDNIAQTLAKVDYFALLLTRAALTKRWVLAETRMALTREIENGRPRVIVLRLEDCEIPAALRHKVFLDFRGRFDSAFAELAEQLKGVDLSIATPKQAVVAEIIANADAGLWEDLSAGTGGEWEQDEAASLIRDLRSDELEAAVAISAQLSRDTYKTWEDDLLHTIHLAAEVNDARARRIIGRLVELGFLEQATDLDYSKRSSNAWCPGSVQKILLRAARQSKLFPILPPPIPDRISSLLTYERRVWITGIGWYAVRFDKPLITSVDSKQPAIVAISRSANPKQTWIFRQSNDRIPLVTDRSFPLSKLVPGDPYAYDGEFGKARIDLSTFDDLGLLRG